MGEETEKKAKKANFIEVADGGTVKPQGSWAKQLWENKVALAIIVGMIGLFAGVKLFTLGDNLYGEIGIDKKPVFDLLFTRRIACLDTTIKMVNAEKPSTLYGLTLADATKEHIKKLVILKSALAITLRERQMLDSGNTDTSLAYFNRMVAIGRDTFATAITGGKWEKGPVKVPATLMDTCHLCATYPATVRIPVSLVQTKKEKPIDFFSGYPQFGFWIVFSIAQMVLWFMTIPLLIGNVKNLNDKLLNDDYKIGFWRIMGNTILPLIFVGLFCYLFYGCLLQKRVISDDYFLSNFSTRSEIYGIVGYGVASICFGVYLALARKLDKINDDIVTNAISPGDPNLNAAYIALKAAFDNSFLFSALILSFCVLWSGILVSALNDTEAFRYYHMVSGKYLIPNDFVYLVGIMHTLILLIFYIPMKLKFDSLSITQSSAGTVVAPGTPSPAKSIFSVLSDSIGPLLITASPLLASLIHSLLGMVTK